MYSTSPAIVHGRGYFRTKRPSAIKTAKRLNSVAWVGSPDFYGTAALGQNDGVLALRQPGSSLKPFVYAEAMARLGWTGATLLPDLELSVNWNLPYGPFGGVPSNYTTGLGIALPLLFFCACLPAEFALRAVLQSVCEANLDIWFKRGADLNLFVSRLDNNSSARRVVPTPFIAGSVNRRMRSPATSRPPSPTRATTGRSRRSCSTHRS